MPSKLAEMLTQKSACATIEKAGKPHNVKDLDTMKCQIQWIDDKGRPTPDQNEAVAMANYHEAIWSHPGGSPDNRIVGYTKQITQSFPICQHHLARMRPDPEWNGWSTSPLPKEEAQ